MAKKDQGAANINFRAEEAKRREEILKLAEEQFKIESRLDNLFEKRRKTAKGLIEEHNRINKAIQIYEDKLKENINTQNVIEDGLINIDKIIKESNKNIKKSLEYYEEIDGAIASISSVLEKSGNKYTPAIKKQLEISKEVIGSISDRLQNQRELTESQVETIKRATKGYGSALSKVADLNGSLTEGKITIEEYNNGVISAYSSFATLINRIDDSTKAGKELKETLEKAGVVMSEFEKSAKASNKQLMYTNALMSQLGSAIPGVGGAASQAFMEMVKGGKNVGLTIVGLIAAAGALAYSLGLLGDRLGTIAKYDIQLGDLGTEIDIIKKSIELGIAPAGQKVTQGFTKNFVAARALIEFQTQQLQNIAQFQAASKTALFGNQIGGVGYAKDQLMLAGISSEKIAEQMKASAIATGQMPTSRIASDMAVFSAYSEQSSESIATLNEAFQRTQGVSAKTALNLQAGMKTMADKAGINFGNLMNEVATSSKDMLGYGIRNVSTLAKQAAFAQSMGISFQEVANAGRNMVLNYKDSIKAEMQLSSLLGEQVDLSEVRQLFALGKNDEAITALKNLGLDPAEMNIFQQEALKEATGGMDLTTLDKINKNQGKDIGQLAAEEIRKGNQQFLERFSEAQRTLSVQSAVITATQEIKFLQLQNEINKSINQAIQGDIYGIKAKMEEVAQVEFMKTAAIGLGAAALGLITAATYLMLAGKGLGIPGTDKFFGSKTVKPNKPGTGPVFNEKTKRYHDPTTGKMVKTPKTTTPSKIPKGGFGKAGQLLGKAGPWITVAAALAEPITDAIEGNVQYQSKNTGQNVGNFVASLGANMLEGVTFGFGTEIAKTVGLGSTVISGLSLTELENLRGAYRSITGEQIGVGAEGTQKLIDWVQKNQQTILATKDGMNEFGGIISNFNEGVASGDIKVSKTNIVPQTASVTAGVLNGTQNYNANKITSDINSQLTKTNGIKSANITPQLTSVTAGTQTTDSWLQNKLIYMSGNLEKVVTRTDKLVTYSSNIAKYTGESNQKLTELTNNTTAILQLTRVMEGLAAEEFFRQTGEKEISLKVDGKTLAVALNRFNKNNQGQKKPGA